VARVVGIDPSPALLAKARELAQGMESIEFEEGDGKALRFADGTLDVVILHTLLTHVPNRSLSWPRPIGFSSRAASSGFATEISHR
jgi:ubiquinone/menaquinone biosynthesis C-methylase UbiE